MQAGAILTDSLDISDRLTAVEKQLFAFLLSVLEHHGLADTVLRVAGGWVRDKLLHRNSDDIDVALNNMKGVQFAEYINEYLKARGEAEHNVGVIRMNPEQSKHLETATMHLFGISVDFVNLRSESYSDASRIPTSIDIGTAEQDALRRDLTFNALFYNINTAKIEDFTGRGIRDLRDGLVRTPLDPLTTFTDDPLRVLRAVRFAARLQFSLDPALVDAARAPAVLSALATKISRERIGAEVDGMLSCRSPALAVALLFELQLFDIVFALPPTTLTPPPSAWSRESSAHVLNLFRLVRVLELPQFAQALARCAASTPTPMTTDAAAAAAGTTVPSSSSSSSSSSAPSSSSPSASLFLNDARQRRMLTTYALLLSLRNVQHQPGKGRPMSVGSWLILNSLKWPRRDADELDTVLSHADRFAAIGQPACLMHFDSAAPTTATPPLAAATPSLPTIASSSCASTAATGTLCAHFYPINRRALGSLLRSCGPLWRDSLLISVLLQLAHTGAPVSDDAVAFAAQRYVHVVSEVARLSLDAVWELRPLLNGEELRTSLAVPKGPELGRLLQRQIDYMLEYPQCSVDDVLRHLRERSG